MKKIAIIGRKPKPYGGLSIFVQRLESKLIKEKNHVLSIDPRDKASIIKFTVFSPFEKWDKIIINNFSLLFLVLLFLTNKLKFVTLVDHNHSRHFNKKNKIYINVLKLLIPKIDTLWLVSSHLKENYFRYDIKEPKKTIVKSPYIPVSSDILNQDKRNIPQDLKSMIKNQRYTFINSSSQSISSLSEDIYGIKDSIEAIANINDSNLIISHSIFNEKIKNEIEGIAKNLNINDRVHYIKGDFPLWAVFSDITAFLRTTKTDGNSVSIMEALDTHTPVIASDSVPRPNGCYIYQTGNVEDLSEKILSTIQNNVN